MPLYVDIFPYQAQCLFGGTKMKVVANLDECLLKLKQVAIQV